MEEESECTSCSVFEPQAWRKSLCRNCFKTFEDHSEELLAIEAKKVEEEIRAKVEGKEKTESESKKPESVDKNEKVKVEDTKTKVKVEDTKTKVKVEEMKAKVKSDSKVKGFDSDLKKSKDVGLDFAKSKSFKSSTLAKSEDKLSSTDSRSKPPPSSSSSSSSLTSTTASTAQSTSSLSKAKALGSKFESKAGDIDTSKTKPSKPNDLRLSSNSFSSVSSKFSKYSDKTPNTPDDKLVGRKQITSEDEKFDSKKSKISDLKSPGFRPDRKRESTPLPGKDTKTQLKNEEISDKKSVSKFEEKDQKSNSKKSPFSKVMLKSTKDNKDKSETINEQSVGNLRKNSKEIDKNILKSSKNIDTKSIDKEVSIEVNKKSKEEKISMEKSSNLDDSPKTSESKISEGKGYGVDRKLNTLKQNSSGHEAKISNTLSRNTGRTDTTLVEENESTKKSNNCKTVDEEKDFKSSQFSENKNKSDVFGKFKLSNDKNDVKTKNEEKPGISIPSTSSTSSHSKSLDYSSKVLDLSQNLGTNSNGKINNETETKSSNSCSTGSKKEKEILDKELEEKENRLEDLRKQVTEMEKQMSKLEKEKSKSSNSNSDKESMERILQDLRGQLSKMEKQCVKLETDNTSLTAKLKEQEEAVKKAQKDHGKTEENDILERDLELAEQELEDVKDENSDLKSQIMEMKNEMDEMYDTFREKEHDEFREIQKELDMTAKNCRILQFKLRKAERRNDQIEEDRQHYEEKLRQLQDQFDSQDAKDHIRVLEEELRIAKEVSVRLHDELDIMEDRRLKALEENKHLTELLEHTDKRQFRMEMEIDKLRELVSDLKMQIRETERHQGSKNNLESPSETNKPPSLGVVGKQGSKEYDVSQLMKDLCDSMERENDLKDQLKFTEEEAKLMRKRGSALDEENENLRLQLQKMSEKASKHKKKEKQMEKLLEEERRQTEIKLNASLTDAPRVIESDTSGDVSTDVVLVVAGDGSEVWGVDEGQISQRKDSTDEDLMNVMQLRVQLEMLEQELMTSQKKMDDVELENENLTEEVKFLQERLKEECQEKSEMKEPASPSEFYQEKLREVSQELDELRWKLIEKDRELERLEVVQSQGQARQEREHARKREKLKKSKSLDTPTDPVLADLRKQYDHNQMELIRCKQQVSDLEERNEELTTQLEESKNGPSIPSIKADDAAVENIELRDRLQKLQEENRDKTEKIRSLTENLQTLSRDTRSYASAATSPTNPGNLCIPDIPLPIPDSDPHPPSFSCGASQQQHEPSNNAESYTTEECLLSTVPNELEDRSVSTTTKNTTTTTNTTTTSTTTTTTTQPLFGAVNISKNPDFSKKSNTALKDFEDNRDKLENLKMENITTGPTATSSTDIVNNSGGTEKDDKLKEKDDKGDDKKKDKDRKKRSDEGQKEKSILVNYPDGRSNVVVSGEETRVELMEKVLEMDDEIGDLIKYIRKKEDDTARLSREIKYLKNQLDEVKDESRRTELDLLQELDMLHDKNSVMSNLLDIINERAEAAEEELERRVQEDGVPSPARSESNVSQVSALSDTSMGSDEVFPMSSYSKEGVVNRDWEGKLKTRIESLERLLAEERQKVLTAEKKLVLSGIDSLAPSVSDDVKLRLREKELLQEELMESQRHLHIAADQIKGLRDRLNKMEDEHSRLKLDYEKLYIEIDKPLDKEGDDDEETTDSDKTPENAVDSDPDIPFIAKKVSVVEAPNLQKIQESPAKQDVATLKNELEKYKQRAEELEFKVEEINDVWKSKSKASDKEKDDLEKELNRKIKDLIIIEETLEKLRQELCNKDKTIVEYETLLREKDNTIFRKNDLMQEIESEKLRIEENQNMFLTQLTQKDANIRGLNETIRTRDERLKEKDEILCKLNQNIDEIKQESEKSKEKARKLSNQISEKDAVISVLQNQISTNSDWSREEGEGCKTDVEKECGRLRDLLRGLKEEKESLIEEKKKSENELSTARKALDETMLQWNRQRNSMQKDANILQERLRVNESIQQLEQAEVYDMLKRDLLAYFTEKEELKYQLNTTRKQIETKEKTHQEQLGKLQGELTEKLRQLKAEVENNALAATELDRLTRQAEMAYRLQQEERILRAELLAMKVRYESRIDKLGKEFNKMLCTLDKVKRERDMDKEILQVVQKNLMSVKDKYTDTLLQAEEDKTVLERQLKEINEMKQHTDSLRKTVRELKEQILDQDRLRSELINKFATDRSSWEMDRANLTSQVNQLEEQLGSTGQQQARARDIQTNMGLSWEKERREQRRLLQEAHTLALDLQEQLKCRDESFAHDRKELIRQLEAERLTWAKEKKEMDKKMMELTSANRKLTVLQRRLKETQENADHESEAQRIEKQEIMRQLEELRSKFSQDSKHIENILSGLIRLRELGTSLNSPDLEPSTLSPEALIHKQELDKNVLAYVKEAVSQVNASIQELSNHSSTAASKPLRRSTSSSEISLLKDELTDSRHQDTDEVFIVTDMSCKSTTTPFSTPLTTPLVKEKEIKINQKADLHQIAPVSQSNFFQKTKTFPENKPQELKKPIDAQPTLSKDPPLFTSGGATGKTPPSSASTAPPIVIMRPVSLLSKRFERPPSYTSGSRSANASRATTPETPEPPIFAINDTSLFSKSGLPNVPPSFLLSQSKQPHTNSLTSSLSITSSKPKRPVTFTKSLSVDSSEILDFSSKNTGKIRDTISAENKPTTPSSISELHSSLLYNSPHPTKDLYGGNLQDKFSPRTARRRFFETPASCEYPTAYQSWPERRGHAATGHSRQTSLPDPRDVRKEAEEEYEQIKNHEKQTVNKQSSKSLENVNKVPENLDSSTKSTVLQTDIKKETKTAPKTAKEKRKFFKKSQSLDSTVGSIAKVGVSVMASPAAPSGFAPFELFGKVKGKLKPVFKRKSVENPLKIQEGEEEAETKQIIEQTLSEKIPTQIEKDVQEKKRSDQLCKETEEEERQDYIAELNTERSRGKRRLGHEDKKWRSKSADSAHFGQGSKPVWKFTETAL